MSDRLGVIIRHWEQIEDDGEIWEYRERVDAIADCPVCGGPVELLAETDAWCEGPIQLVKGKPRKRWIHDGYGPAATEHCGKLIADWWEGTFVYDLEKTDG